MMEFFSKALDSGQIWTWLAAAAAMVSVIYAGLPFLDRADARDRVRSVIVERRRSLAASQREAMAANAALIRRSASQSLADLFQIQRFAGIGNVRERLASAGYRSPRAALVFMLARIGAPLVMALLSFAYTAGFDLSTTARGMIVISAAIFGFFLPLIFVINAAQKRREEVANNFPDALDLMLVCVEGGLGAEAAIDRVAQEIEQQSEVLAEELGLLGAELALLGDRAGAFRNFAARVVEPSARSFANTLVQAEKYGTSLGRALRTLASDMRDQRMSKAERIAAALPAKLTVPMIVFFMPGLFVVILGPAIIKALETFGGG